MKTMTSILATLLMTVSIASAGNIGFDEGALTQTGTISYDGEGGSLIGNSIVFSTILGTDTPSNAGSILTCTSCMLNFLTGANTLEGPTQWNFGAGGLFSVTGTVFNGAVQIATGNLLSGTFGLQSSVIGTSGSGLFVGFGADSKHDDLEAFYGYPANKSWDFASTTLSLNTCSAPGNGGFSCGVLNADLNNVSVDVPSPGPVGLMGAGLFALGLVARKRKA